MAHQISHPYPQVARRAEGARTRRRRGSHRLHRRRRALIAASAVATAAMLALASCGQPTSNVEAGAPAAAPATSAHGGHTTGGSGGSGPVPSPTTAATGHTGGHMGGPGFTEVPGGVLLDQPEHAHDGMDPCMAPVTPPDYEAADRLIADTVASVGKYHHLDDAMEAGYVQIAPPFNGEGAHYLNPAYMGDGQFLNPERVESLVYRDDTLEAAMYMMDTADQPGIDVAGCLTPWHLHDNLCIAEGFQIVGLSDWGDCPSGSENRPTPPMLHVWLIPHEGGPFAGIFT